jgi:hypothetical protein
MVTKRLLRVTKVRKSTQNNQRKHSNFLKNSQKLEAGTKVGRKF